MKPGVAVPSTDNMLVKKLVEDQAELLGLALHETRNEIRLQSFWKKKSHRVSISEDLWSKVQEKLVWNEMMEDAYPIEQRQMLNEYAPSR